MVVTDVSPVSNLTATMSNNEENSLLTPALEQGKPSSAVETPPLRSHNNSGEGESAPDRRDVPESGAEGESELGDLRSLSMQWKLTNCLGEDENAERNAEKKKDANSPVIAGPDRHIERQNQATEHSINSTPANAEENDNDSWTQDWTQFQGKHLIVRGNERAESIYRFTPLADGGLFCCDANVWNQYETTTKLKDLEVTPKNVVWHLFANTANFNMLAHSYFINCERTGSARDMIERIFSEEPTKGSRSHSWYHALIQCVLLDRLVWSQQPLSSTDNRHWPMNPDANVLESRLLNDIPAVLQPVAISCKNWQTLLRDVIRGPGAMLSRTRNDDAPWLRGISQAVKQDEIASSFIRLIIRSATDAHMSNIVANFCSAALGIRLLMLVSYEAISIGG